MDTKGFVRFTSVYDDDIYVQSNAVVALLEVKHKKETFTNLLLFYGYKVSVRETVDQVMYKLLNN